MQSYKSFKKNSLLSKHFFCQHASTLKRKKSLLISEDTKRNQRVVEQIYLTLADSHYICKKKQNEFFSFSLKKIIFSYILHKIKNIGKVHGWTSSTITNQNNSHIHAQVRNNTQKFHSFNSYHDKFHRHNHSLSKNEISHNCIHPYMDYPRNARKKFLAHNYQRKTKRNLKNCKNEKLNLEKFHSCQYTKCNKTLYPNYYPFEKGITNRYQYFSYVSFKQFGTDVQKGRDKKKQTDCLNKVRQKGDEAEGSIHITSSYIDVDLNDCEIHTNHCSNIDNTHLICKNEKRETKNAHPEEREQVFSPPKNVPNSSSSSSSSSRSGDDKNFSPNEEYEHLKVKELEKILHNLEKLYENKNSRININIKILVYVFKNFIHKNKELKIKIFFSFIFLLCSKISIIYTPILLSSFIENVNLQKSLNNKLDSSFFNNNSSVMILLSYVLSRILSSSLNELRNSVFSTISQRISTYVSKLFFYKIHNLNLSYILSKKNGELSFIFNRGCKSITNLLNVLVFQIIPIIIEFVLYLYILTYKIHYSVSLVTCLNMLLYIIFTTLVTKRRTIIRKYMNKSEQNTFNIFLDSIQNIEQVKYYTNEMHELKKFIKEQKKFEKEAINVQKSLSFLNFGQQIILNFNLFLCLYLTYINIANDIFPFSYLILVNTLLFQLAMPLNMFGTIYRETKLSLVDIECMIKILVKKIQSMDYTSKLEIQTGNIKFENVSFKYPILDEKKKQSDIHINGDEKNSKNEKGLFLNIFTKLKNMLFFQKKFINPIIDSVIPPKNDEIKNNLKSAIKENVNATVYPFKIRSQNGETNMKENNNYIFQNFTCNIGHGEKVAIIGKSGLGKSTLIKLLLKFYEINSGNIYIDNKNIKNINLYTLRKSISVVPQDTILFNNTISYNIKYGNFQCTDQQMMDACIQSELHEKILQMDKQYDTLVGERGTKLSIGEKQRICIARCFLKNSKIVVLDEHASNLDNENKKCIEKALQKLCNGKTTFLITHVMENLQNMDKIIFFSGNNNIYVGNHNELMTGNTFYREFYDSKNNQLI
ncbi:ABC transporter [Plasmodium gonderi]|uniref:ABC transporter n=1 Tax=Plasmodium gonderi TaxID=77519 RepID=A0A1Y1JKS4_PLAGO|nr:ABC transporter [Plasmodium gonderi]GAW82055.1 ABC transporter [Plasmodium gonderi]